MTVLFCDLRGFSRESERSADDLFGLLERVSRALGVMTHHILEEGGVIGDFHGDAAMGFWGWPIAQADAARGPAGRCWGSGRRLPHASSSASEGSGDRGQATGDRGQGTGDRERQCFSRRHWHCQRPGGGGQYRH